MIVAIERAQLSARQWARARWPVLLSLKSVNGCSKFKKKKKKKKFFLGRVALLRFFAPDATFSLCSRGGLSIPPPSTSAPVSSS